MSKEYEKMREKIQKDFKDKLDEKDRKIFYLEKLVKDVEEQNRQLKIENSNLRKKVGQPTSSLQFLMSQPELAKIYGELCNV